MHVVTVLQLSLDCPSAALLGSEGDGRGWTGQFKARLLSPGVSAKGHTKGFERWGGNHIPSCPMGGLSGAPQPWRRKTKAPGSALGWKKACYRWRYLQGHDQEAGVCVPGSCKWNFGLRFLLAVVGFDCHSLSLGQDTSRCWGGIPSWGIASLPVDRVTALLWLPLGLLLLWWITGFSH